ncbi:MAG: hypothetical protein M9920_05665 [Verrucomicrobiae bacterium]|nr:hypothetical protein [Verrucomicrobiae bacterium]
MATSTPILLKTFDTAIAEKISPFFTPLGARHVVGESCYDERLGPSSLKLKSYAELDGRFFWWINRFIVDGTTLDIAFGDREFLIETAIFYDKIKNHFAPWELLSAAKVPNAHVISGEAWVLEPDFMVRIVERMAQGIQQHWNIISKATPPLIDRVCVMRNSRMIFNQEEQRRKDRERASTHASAAFHAGRYAEARSLLEPFKRDRELPPSAAKILELAEKKLS